MNPKYSAAVNRRSDFLNYSRSAEGTQKWLHTGPEPELRQSIFETPLEEGEVLYVAPDMCRLLEQTVLDIPSTTFHASLLPLPTGFITFDGAIRLPEQDPGADGYCPLASRLCMGWSQHTLNDRLLTFCCVYTHEPDSLKFEPYGWFTIFSGQDLSAGHVGYSRVPGSGLKRYINEADPRHELRYFTALLLLLKEKLLIAAPQRLDRATQRRVRKSGAGDVQLRVVGFRRAEYRDKFRTVEKAEAEHGADWSCQWIVRGHWRNQPYRREKVNRPIWIMAYVKGPGDKPLKTPRKSLLVLAR